MPFTTTTVTHDPPTHNSLGQPCWGAYLIDMGWYKYSAYPSPFLHGVLCSSHLNITVQTWLFATLIVVSVIVKRRSARPGGHIYRYNQRQVHKFRKDRRRKLRDMLKDPVLARDMERRYGDLESLRESVKQWELDGFTPQKKEDNDCIKIEGKLVVPWIKVTNIWLSVTFFLTFYCSFSRLTVMILTGTLVNIIDNMLLQRAALSRMGRRGSDQIKPKAKGPIAAVGVPLPDVKISAEVEVGIPVNGILTV